MVSSWLEISLTLSTGLPPGMKRRKATQTNLENTRMEPSWRARTHTHTHTHGVSVVQSLPVLCCSNV